MKVDQKFQAFLASFRGVNWNNPGSWPMVVKGTVYLSAFVLVLGAAYMVFVTKLNKQIESEQKKEAGLLTDYEEKAFKAMNLDSYKKQLVDMEEAFGALLRQLPKDTEVPSLLEDINHTGLGSGLEFQSIDLGQEVKQEFYAELPISIKARGDYHGFGAFVSGVASLPRIVTLHDFTIGASKPAGGGAKGASTKKESGPRLLDMAITAKIYRYSDGSEVGADDKSKGGGK